MSRKQAGNQAGNRLAAARTIGLFSGLTMAEEAERDLREGFADEREPADRSYDGARADMVANAILWLGLDEFETGDDVMLAIGPKSDGVLLVISGGKYPGRQAQVRLSRRQLAKLKRLANQIP